MRLMELMELIMLYHIDLPYACYGIEVKNNRVVEAPPIAKWMEGKSFMFVAEWINKKGGKIENSKDKSDK